MSTLKQTLLELKSKVDIISNTKQTPDTPYTREQFQNEILPLLIALRGINRREKHESEAYCQRKKDYYQRLIAIQQLCECIEFEALCLKSDVDTIRHGLNNDCTRNGLDVDHATRMQLLDAEENRRRELQKKLNELTEETKEIELSYSKKADSINQVRPYIKQLLEKVNNIL